MPVVSVRLTVEDVGLGTVYSDALSSYEVKTERQSYTIATATTNQSVTLPPSATTIDFILIVSDQTITLKQVSGDTGHTGKLFLITSTSATALLVSNSSGSTANVKVFYGYSA